MYNNVNTIDWSHSEDINEISFWAAVIIGDIIPFSWKSLHCLCGCGMNHMYRELMVLGYDSLWYDRQFSSCDTWTWLLLAPVIFERVCTLSKWQHTHILALCEEWGAIVKGWIWNVWWHLKEEFSMRQRIGKCNENIWELYKTPQTLPGIMFLEKAH